MEGNTFPVVAIGASAGGLEALSELVSALETKAGMAYVVVQHLNPEHKSLLSELLAKKTAVPVVEVRDELELEPDKIYVIPPNKLLRLKGDRFSLSPRDKDGAPHHPVDVLFVSLASVRGEAAIGVVLSGGDADGMIGVQTIKHAGGITFAQTPESARFPSMPKNAIASGCVDFALEPRQIALELNRLVAHPYLRDLRRPDEGDAGENTAVEQDDEVLLRRIFHRLRAAHGVDFAHYKRSTLRRRLARRMALRKSADLAEYASTVEQDQAETAALYQDFLIRVTGFFRDPESFEGLRTRAFPTMCEGRSPKEAIRIWVPGCATGEEVYSIAIALVDYLGDRAANSRIQIFGTDVSEAAIEKARSARYAEAIAEEIPTGLLERYFVKDAGQYHVVKKIRDLCIFARQDVTRDPPFSRLDLVSCRNLLIYLEAAAQRRIMQVFHYSLRPHAFLMLGPSESVGVASDLFELVDKQQRIYARKSGVSMIESGDFSEARPNPPRAERDIKATEPGVGGVSAEVEADRILLARYAPASLLIDEDLHILQFRGETGGYLEHASGPSSLNLRRVVRPELLVELSPAIDEVRRTGQSVRREGLSVGELTNVTVEVIPLTRSNIERAYLIVLDDASRRQIRRTPTADTLSESDKDRRLAQLEREIVASRDYLQVTLEQHAAVQEELKSAHEEVLSANEEFQSTNEELETAKEELQSSNEELTTTNDELRARNRELAVLNSDLRDARDIAERARAYADAIISSVREPLVVLDANLKILRANGSFYKVFDIARSESDGLPIEAMGFTEASSPDLLGQLHAVLTRNTALNDYELSYRKTPASEPQVLLINARKIPEGIERKELILLSVEDVTERSANAHDLREGSRRKDEFLAMLAHELRNPLTPIAHAVHLLQQGASGAPTAELYDLIDRQTSRLIRLVDDLLDVARISRGHIEIKREIADLAGIVRNAAESVRPRLDRRQQKLGISVPSTPVCIDGDPVRLEQVVSNLLDNAGKYSPAKGRIQLKLTRDDAWAVLSIQDNGIGLAAQDLRSIFDLFAQVDKSLARSGGGLGIGLTLVRRVLELHGGRVEARSAGLGHGTEFVMWLPIASTPAPTSKSQRTTPRSLERSARHRVLVVDDNEDVAQSIAMLVSFMGHEVAIASNGETALEMARRFKPERALVDIGLPDITGYALAEQLRAEHPDLYLIALSGYGTNEDRVRAQNAGFHAHLAKPATPELLQEALTGPVL